MKEIIKIKNHRISNYIKSELISDESNYCGISANWLDDEYSKYKSEPPITNEVYSIRIEGNYELEQSEYIWVYFETWDSNQNGISKKEHIDANRLCFGQIQKIDNRQPNFIDCKFRVSHLIKMINKIEPKTISEKWKSILIDFAKMDFTGSLLTVFKFENYLNATCQTDGGPYFNFIFEIDQQIRLRQIIECDKYADELITYTNETIDLELENILRLERERRIKAFKYKERGFNEFLFYVDEKETNNLKNEISKGNKLILRKGWKREVLDAKTEIDSTLNKMRDYH